MSEPRSRQTLLIVDDNAANISVLSEILRHDYHLKAATNGRDALAIALQKPAPDLILLDVLMPDMDGYEVCRQLKSHPLSNRIPVIFITAMDDPVNEERGFALGAVDYISKPVSQPIVLARVRTQLALHQQNLELEKKVELRTQELKRNNLAVIQRLGRAAEFKDNETGLHVIRMSYYSRLIASQISQDESWADLVFQAAPMHDIGKIGIPDRIMLKAGKLDQAEWREMQMHPIIGSLIIGDHDSELLIMAKDIALTHHEKWDGSGYPYQLSGEHIPLTGRVVAIADVFDALTTNRPYKRAWSLDDALAFIDSQAGRHFDPVLVRCFLAGRQQVEQIMQSYREKSDLHIDQL